MEGGVKVSGGINESKDPYHQEQWYKVLGEEIVMTKENSRKRFVHLRARSIETKKK